jgi:putative ABC transport system permease protein
VLLVGAGVLLRSFWRVLEVRPGFNPEHLTTLQIWIPISNNPDADPYGVEEKRADFLVNVSRRVSALPGVEQASVSGNDTLPMNSGRNYSPFSIPGRASESERSPVADIAVVDTKYFSIMEVPLIAGRNFTDFDTYKTKPVALIDHSLARQYWPDKDPLGQEIKFQFGRGLQGLTIVGVVGDIKSDEFEAPSVPHIYVALGQFAPVNAVVCVKSRSDVAQIGEAVRHEVETLDANVPVYGTTSMDQIIARSMANRRFALELLGVFAAVALLLACVGIYGVMAYSFSQRTREVGIRVALGAQRADILFMALGEGIRIVISGLAIGLAGAVMVARVYRSMLFGIGPGRSNHSRFGVMCSCERCAAGLLSSGAARDTRGLARGSAGGVKRFALALRRKIPTCKFGTWGTQALTLHFFWRPDSMASHAESGSKPRSLNSPAPRSHCPPSITTHSPLM